MGEIILELLLDALIDTAKLLPFLFLTYLLLEWIEHKAARKTAAFAARAGVFGPAVGGLLGAVPQCGFSASAASLYAGGIISAGTLVAIFLSTSDEMLPVMISEKAAPSRILLILGIKIVCAVLVGFLVDFILYLTHKTSRKEDISHLCEEEHCHCEKGIFRSALVHTLQIALFIFLLSLLIGGLIEAVGEDRLSALTEKAGVLGPIVCGLIGLIPNCASSTVLTKLFLGGIVGTGSMLAGLLAGSGVGLLILFRVNKNIRENLLITAVIYVTGVAVGILFDLLGVVL